MGYQDPRDVARPARRVRRWLRTCDTGRICSGRFQNQLLGLLIVAIAASLFGHVANLRARVLSFSQIELIRGLNRQARRDHERVDRLNAALERAAGTDTLTGLGSRLALKSGLALTRSRIERHGERYCLAILDLDRFKAINDALGHLGGDDALRAAANALSRALRAGDAAYRFGGEEFAILMRVGSQSESRDASDRLRRAIERLQIPNAGNARMAASRHRSA